jgi:replicative DNA helicase
MNNTERLIVSNLLNNEQYVRSVLPYLKEEYFEEKQSQLILNEVNNFYNNYKTLPSLQAVVVEVSNKDNISQPVIDSVVEVVENCNDYKEENIKWLIETTENFCKEKALFNSIMESISIIDGKSKMAKTAIPTIIQEALAVSFDSSIGHDYIEDAEERFDYYLNREAKIPFDIEILNTITNGGVQIKTLNLLLAGTNVGKTLIQCHLAAGYLLQGKNVLYITLEMSEQEISKRIDANIINVAMDDIEFMDKNEFVKRVKNVKSKSSGRLLVKEFPTSSAHVGHFKNLIEELKLKQKFIPDIIFIDYLTICASQRLKPGSVNSYTYYKAIAEELRALAIEYEVPVWSAMQLNRSGFSNTDADMDDTSESFGVPFTADFMLFVSSTDELEALRQLMFKQIKSRYRDKNKNKRFVVGIDRPKMRLFDCEQSAQDDIVNEDISVFDKTNFGNEDTNRNKKGKTFRGKGLNFDEY